MGQDGFDLPGQGENFVDTGQLVNFNGDYSTTSNGGFDASYEG